MILGVLFNTAEAVVRSHDIEHMATVAPMTQCFRTELNNVDTEKSVSNITRYEVIVIKLSL